MIRLTHLPAARKQSPALVLIPGGPGLSSGTLRSLEFLSRSFHLYFVDFAGTGGVPYEEHTFEEFAEGLAGEIAGLGPNVFVLGHSFGGFFAGRAALDAPNVRGLICVDVPFTAKSLQAVGKAYNAAKGPALSQAEDAYASAPSDATYAKWVAECGEFYFHPSTVAAGSQMLLTDRVSARLYAALRGEATRLEPILAEISKWKGNKLFVAPEGDTLLPRASIQQDVMAAGFDFRIVKNAHHFVMFDQPEAAARLIEEFVTAAQPKENA